MAWFVCLLKFILGVVGFMSLSLFVLSCIKSVVSPNIGFIDGKIADTSLNSRLIFALIMSISLAALIAIS